MAEPTIDERLDTALKAAFSELNQYLTPHAPTGQEPVWEKFQALGAAINDMRDRNGQLLTGQVADIRPDQETGDLQTQVIQLQGGLNQVMQNYGALMHCTGVTVSPGNWEGTFVIELPGQEPRIFRRGGGDAFVEVDEEGNAIDASVIDSQRDPEVGMKMREGAAEHLAAAKAGEVDPIAQADEED
ncbi:MAG: hypothetical protein MJA83_06280 [Gammaproteobacteria bacterium]|nr:hypothetical protein [Gammaproteobacteria bacterium]